MTQTSDLIDRVRGATDDWGASTTDNIVLTGNDASGTIYQLSNGPIKSVPVPVLTDNAVVKSYGTDFTVNFNNSELTVNYTQTSGHTLAVRYTKVLNRDERIITGLADGIRRLYPYVYKQGECYVSLATQDWTYDLASTTDVPEGSTFGTGVVPADYIASVARADMLKPQTRIHRAEYLPVGSASTMAWQPFYNFRRSTARDFSTDTTFNSGDVLRLIYSAPCTPPVTADDLIDVPDAFIDLPKWYALGVLLEGKESVRVRSDSYQTQNSASANPVGAQMNTAASYFKLFFDTLRNNPMRPMATDIRRTSLIRRTA